MHQQITTEEQENPLLGPESHAWRSGPPKTTSCSQLSKEVLTSPQGECDDARKTRRQGAPSSGRVGEWWRFLELNADLCRVEPSLSALWNVLCFVSTRF